MRTLFSTGGLLLLTGLLTLGVFAQKEKSKDELLKEIVHLSNTKKPEDADKAYQLGKEFIARFPKDKNIDKIRSFLKNYREQVLFPDALANKKYAELFAIGKEILSDQPENVGVTMTLGYGGYAAFTSGEKAFRDDGLKYCQLTLQLMEKGVVPANYAPFISKENALAWLNFISGYFLLDSDAKAAAAAVYKATLYETEIKKTPEPYLMIAQYYEKKVESMTKELNARAKTISNADFNAEKAKIDVLTEQLMGVYARALKNAEATNHPAKVEIKNQLKELYKFQKKTEAGFEPFLTYIVTTEFKDPSTF